MLINRVAPLIGLVGLSIHMGCAESGPLNSDGAVHSPASAPRKVDPAISSDVKVIQTVFAEERETICSSLGESHRFDENEPATFPDLAKSRVLAIDRWGDPYDDTAQNVTTITDRGAHIIAERCMNLRLLRIQHALITDVGLKQLATIPTLEVAILGKCQITREGLNAFKAQRPNCVVRIFPRTLYYIPCSAQQLRAGLIEGPGVLLRHEVTDADIHAIAAFYEVRWIETMFARERDFDPNPELSDESMAILAGLPNLEELTIFLAPLITNNGLTLFYNHPTLRRLELGETSITEDGIAEFRRAMPQCELVTGLRE